MSANPEEFRAIFDATYPKVAAYARRRATDAVADDVVAETFLAAWRRRDEVSAMGNPLPWLYAVAGNQLRNQHRSANRHLRLVSKVAGDVAAVSSTPLLSEPDADVDPDVEVVRAALATLSFDDQEVLRLIAWEELTYRETAEVIGCSLDAVAQRIRRAKHRLAAAIEGLDTNATDAAPSNDAESPRTHTRGA